MTKSKFKSQTKQIMNIMLNKQFRDDLDNSSSDSEE